MSFAICSEQVGFEGIVDMWNTCIYTYPCTAPLHSQNCTSKRLLSILQLCNTYNRPRPRGSQAHPKDVNKASASDFASCDAPFAPRL